MPLSARLLVPAVLAAVAALLAAEPAGTEGLQTPPDLALDLIARDPVVAQPVFLNFDERGRMWVVQYLQYPEPAGLKVLSRDSVWRVRYDRPKPPPPYDTPDKAAFRGRDRITILEDVKGDGSFTSVKTFVEGLNITSSVVRGRGGVWVMSPPQLLWYPDANDDDVPDGPPTVVLDGFGIEDTHSVANSMRWGPDGWLYGGVGSTVTCDIVRPGLDREPVARMVGQGIWRYHPESRRFEVFAEGGGNTFGCEIDAKGRIFSGHNGGDTRGFHYVQGGYLRKGFDKHGELSNPYAFGFFPAMPHGKVQRYSHNFILYEGGALPERYRGKLIGVDPMNNYLPLAEITPRGATFATRDIDAVIKSEDKTFRPVDIKHGPDGAIYVADWRDFQINHYRNHEGQITREDGRIYRIRARDTKPGVAPFDLRQKTSAELLALLRHENRWWRESARQILGERRDAALVPALRAELERNESGPFALEALWALNLSGGFDATVARALFKHRDPYVRAWAVRLVGDTNAADPSTARALAGLAVQEDNVEVRSQLAASAKRFPADVALPIVRALLAHDEDLSDPYLPLQLWWAIESKCADRSDDVLALFSSGAEESPWRYPMVRTHIAARLMRRFAAAGGARNFAAAARLLSQAPDAASRGELVKGFELAFEGRVLPVLPDALVAALVKAGGGSLSLRMRQKDPAALEEGLRLMMDPVAPLVERVRVITTLGEVPQPAAADQLATLLSDGKPGVVRAALAAAAAYDVMALTQAILSRYAQLNAEERTIALSVLASRRASGRALVGAIERGEVPSASVPSEMQEKLRLVADAELAPRIDRLFGRKPAARPEALTREIGRIFGTVREGRGSPYGGRTIYEQRCLACHRFFNRGGEIGPDLTAFKRDDVPNLILSIVHPDAEIREGYEPFVLTRKDGTVHSGFLASQDARHVVIRDMAGLSATVERDAIASLQGMGASLMPQGLLSGLSDQELRDLFAYLRMTQPLVGKE
jgi:putative heme-binding domain-containing protein